MDDHHRIQSEPDQSSGKLTGARILVVEDNLLNQKLDAFILSGWGVGFDICDNGFAALEQLKSRPYDLVLMDVRMPGITGLETTRIIRQELALEVPVIGITAFPTEEERVRCIDGGMNSYLGKPVDEHQLYAVVNAFLVSEEIGDVEGEEE